MTDAETQDLESLDAFLADGLISEVVGPVKRGKEATVYCCRGSVWSGRELVAAKIYRPIEQRSFRDDAVYQPGRNRALYGSDLRALERKSRQGRKVQYGVWLHSEYETLRLLYAAGSDVPEPISCSARAILMEFIGELGAPAPMLNRVELGSEARECFERVIDNVALWLRHDRVHADLSPYNILYWQGRLVAIDFPQAIDPRFNPNARALLGRDLENVCRYFSRFGVRADPDRIAGDLWRSYRFSAL